MFKNSSIAGKIIFLLLFLAAATLPIFYFIGNENEKLVLDKETADYFKEIHTSFSNFEKIDVAAMSATMDIFAQDKDTLALYLKKDRKALYAYVLPTFDKLKKEFSITHIYFHLPDGINFLRVHDPETFGDKIDRSTFNSAVTSQVMGFGLELGKNAFALRVVKPYLDSSGNVVGYLEFGEEIDKFLNGLKEETGDELALFGAKKYMDKASWESFTAKTGLSTKWDDFEGNIILSKTKDIPGSDQCFNGTVADAVGENESYTKKISINGNSYICSGFTIVNPGQERVGVVLSMHNYSGLVAINDNARNLLFFSIIGGMLTWILVAYLFLLQYVSKPLKIFVEAADNISKGRLDQSVDIKTGDELGSLARAFNQMAGKLKESISGLEDKVSSRTAQLNDKVNDLEKNRRITMALLEDIAEQKKDADRLAAIVRDSDDAIISKDLNGTIETWNRGAEMLYGYKEKEAVGKNVALIVPEKNRSEIDDILNIVKSGKSIEHYKTVRVQKSGVLVDVSVTASPIKDSSGQVVGLSVIARDITKEQEVDRAKTEFVSLASHQLRTPLSAIKWYAEMLMDEDAGKMNKEQKNYVQEIYKGNERMVDLVNSMLSVSRLEMGTFAIEPVGTDITETAEMVVKELTPQIKEKKQKFTKEYDKKLPKDYMADPKLLKIILQNLLSNSVKYTPEKGNVALIIKTDDKNIKIMVSDTGYGIPKEEQDKIFTKLFRAYNVRAMDTEGTGLGLYLIKSIVDNVGGKIWFQSEDGIGTTFNVTLPITGMRKKEGTKSIA
jgi:PAS domain S-box-containing protein